MAGWSRKGGGHVPARPGRRVWRQAGEPPPPWADPTAPQPPADVDDDDELDLQEELLELQGELLEQILGQLRSINVAVWVLAGSVILAFVIGVLIALAAAGSTTP